MTRPPDSQAMDSYVLDEPARCSDVFLGERYELEFAAGTVKPKNEAEQHALEALVRHGKAKRARQAKAEKE